MSVSPKRTPEEILKKLKQNFQNFSDKTSFTQLYSIPQKTATYLIYEDSKVIYVGESSQLRTRLRRLLGGRNHTLHNKLREQFGTKQDVQKFLRTNCSFSYCLCKDGTEAKLLERFCISIHSPKHND